MLTGKELGSAIEAAIKLKGVTKKEVAQHFGVQPPSIQDWVKRGTIGKEKLPKLWAYFSDVAPASHWGLDAIPAIDQPNALVRSPDTPITPTYHVAESVAAYASISSELGEPVRLKGMKLLPVVGEVKGGDDGYLEEFQYPVGHGEGFIEYPTADPNAYALRVRGDSMHPRYRAGEFAVVEPNISWQQGDDVVVCFLNGKKMLKQLNWQRDGEVQLLSINNGYAPLTVPMDEIQSIQLVAGRARRSALQK